MGSPTRRFSRSDLKYWASSLLGRIAMMGREVEA